MITCLKCGSDNPDTAVVCKVCSSPLQQSAAKTCPAGKHKMDATWTECPYCAQGNLAPSAPPPVRTPTMFEGSRDATMVEGQPGMGPGGRRLTEREGVGPGAPLPPRPRPISPPPAPQAAPGAPGAPKPRKTEFRPIPTPGATGTTPAPTISKGRKIVAMLISYSWNPDGQVYPIYEGRNLIGRDQDCEVCIPEDTTLSGRNSHITYRQNFVVGDMVSMAGTDVNNVPIEEQFHALPNYSTIRAGSTYFTFVSAAPYEGAKVHSQSTAE